MSGFALKLLILSVIGLFATSATTIVVATKVMEADLDQRMFDRIDTNMKVAWHIIHDFGDNPRIEGGRLIIGNTALNGNADLVNALRDMLGGVATVFQADKRITTTVENADGLSGVGTRLAPGPARAMVLDRHKSFRGLVDILGTQYYSGYDPIFDDTGLQIGILYVGIKKSEVSRTVEQARRAMLIASTATFCLIAVIFLVLGRYLTQQITLRERGLKKVNEDLAVAFDNMANGLCRWSELGTLIVANKRAADILALPPNLLIQGLSFRAFLHLRSAAGGFEDRDFEGIYSERIAWIAERKPLSIIDHQQGGRMVAIEYRPVDDGGWVNTYEDVTEREQAQARITYLARHDSLTDLANRFAFHEHTTAALASGCDTAILCLDLDRFKDINDTLGHPVGDLLLKAVAGRLLQCVGLGDTVARLGGDEFALIQAPLRQADDAMMTAERILDTVAEPYDLDGNQVVINISVGIVFSNLGAEDPDTLLRQADFALYLAKTDGGGTYRVFEPHMHAHLQARRILEHDLRKALTDNEFEVFYQPLVHVQTGSVSGFEALLRWRHPTRGLIGPAEFIPLAEATGLIVQMGAWILCRACADAAKWPAHLKVAVNLSTIQFRGSKLLGTVSAALTAADLLPTRLELEITESAMLRDPEAAFAILHQLRALGVRIALDDFGTGFSSLSYFRNFPFDKVKIDQSFIDGIGLRPDATAIIHAVAGLATSLGIKTVAEGVETMAQFHWLANEGCDEVQGFLFSPPKPATDIFLMLTRVADVLSGS